MDRKKISQKQEDRIAEDVGGVRQPASGAFWSRKDDVRKPFCVRIETKYTDAGKYRFDPKDYIGLRRRAIMAGEIPGFNIEFRRERLSIVLTEGEHVTFEGIRTKRSASGATYLVKAEYVLELERAAYKKKKPYILEIEFRGITLVGIPYSAFLGVLSVNNNR
jgi:hypothetical protein